jgi:hypothetical protein
MTPGNSLRLVYIGWELLLKLKKEFKLFPSVRPSTALTSFFYPNIQCHSHASELKWVVVLGGFHWHQQSRANNFLYVIPADNSYNESLFISIYSGNQFKSQEKVWAN